MSHLKQKLTGALSERQKHTITGTGRISSAVLIPIFYKDNEYHILFTMRSKKVKYHKGEISFPGGVRSLEDRTLLDTALRESEEEIGLKSSDAEIIGELDDILTRNSNYIIAPYIAFIPYPYSFRLNPDEVDEIIEIPISILMDKSNMDTETEIEGDQILDSYFYHYYGKTVHGATARILHQFLEIIHGIDYV